MGRNCLWLFAAAPRTQNKNVQPILELRATNFWKAARQCAHILPGAQTLILTGLD